MSVSTIPDGYGEGDIAIIGMAAHLPGARTVDEYWQNLVQGTESIRVLSDEELIAAGVSREHLRHPRYVKATAALQDTPLFDGEFFGFSPKESAILDPQHRHFLEVAWEALEDAGHPPEKFPGPIGVYGGCGMGSYFYFNLCSNPDLVDSVGMFLLRHTGNDKDFLVTRVSHIFNLTGPSVNVQTACSTSLVAVHYAVQSLLAEECDMALAGGVTIELPQNHGYFYKEGEVLSPDGHCHAFDARAQGTVFGSGAGVVVLRRLADAIADGDHIHAVIKGTAINNDGASKAGYLAPSVSGQAACIVEAHGLADVSAEDIGYVECHGTGTYLGDPIEVAALSLAFGKSTTKKGYCHIGSVKTNIGHLDTAAGVASLIKAALTVQHGQIAPSLHFETPNPNIDFDDSPFRVASELMSWPGPSPRIAAVNSLGVGGTNAHALLQEPPQRSAASTSKRPYQPLVFSARSKKALDAYQSKLVEHLRAHPEQPLADVAWTLFEGRRAFDLRRVIAASNHAEAIALLEANDPRRVFTQAHVSKEPKLVYLFPGGGAQYPGMTKGLYESEPAFRAKLDQGLAILRGKVDWDPAAVLFGEEATPVESHQRLLQPSIQLPLLLIVEVALFDLLTSWGLKPDALLGHSMGENTAACVAGVLSFEDAIGLVLLRGQLFDSVPKGGMLSVSATAETLKPLLGDTLDLACWNAPQLCVASGPTEALEGLAQRLRDREIDFQSIDIDIAAHSHMLEPILGRFRDYLKRIQLKPPRIPIISNRSGAWLTPEEATDPEYWVRHLRNPVLFAAGMETLAVDAERVYVECGPGRALSSLAKLCPSVEGHQVISALRHPDDTIQDAAYHTALLARLWATGLPVEPSRFFTGETRQRVRLPSYAFQRQHYFIEPGRSVVTAKGVERIEDVTDFGWEPFWTPRHAEPAAELASAHWLVFLDDGGLGQRVCRLLTDAGHQVTRVYPGDSFAKKSTHEYVIAPERGRETYDALVRDLLQTGQVPTRVLHLWLTTADESFRPGSSFFHRNQERGFWSLFFLAQALADENVPRPLHLTVVTNGLQRVLSTDVVHFAEKATVLGPVKVIPREMPGMTVSALDVVLPEPSKQLFGGRLVMGLVDPFAGKKAVAKQHADLAQALLEEITAAAHTDTVALRDGKRYVQSWRKRKLTPTQEVPALRQGGTYLITGGLGGLGLVAAEALAKACQPKLVLVGRSGLPSRDTWDTWLEQHGDGNATSSRIQHVRALEDLGAEVLIAAADVTNVEQMQEAFRAARERFGAIHGVFHTAGTVADNLIQAKSSTSISDVFAPKIHGTLVLDALVREEPSLEFMVLYSSSSTATAPAGQVDYVAANAFLDSFAESRAGQQPRVIAIQWGIWNQVGMAAEAMHTKNLSVGPDALPPTVGPLFDGRRRDAHGQLHLFGIHGPSSHWIYNEHRVKGSVPTTGPGKPTRGAALIPGTGYLELAAEALHELGEHGPFEIRDLLFLRPLQIDDDERREVRVKLRRSDAGYSMEVRSACNVEGRAAWQLHAQCALIMDAPVQAPRHDVAAIEARCTRRSEADPAGIRTPQENHLAFGPRWRVLQSLHWGDAEAVAHLRLPRAFRADLAAGWRLHPAVMDLATGFAMDLIEGYTAREVWVPISYEQVRVWGPLPEETRSWVRNAQGANAQINRADAAIALFDIDIMTPDGQVVLEIRRFAIRRLQQDASFANAKLPTRHEVEFEIEAGEREGRNLSPAEQRLRRNLERGIVPDEGAEALRRVLAAKLGPRVLVSSLDLPALIEEAGTTVSETAGSSAKFARPELDSEYIEPRDDVERTLAGFWTELLGVENVGVKDSFFDLGGHSLIAVRMFAMVKKSFQVDFPISVLFEAPSIETCAALVKEAIGWSDDGATAAAKLTSPPKRRFTHLVAMHPGEGGDRTPFFLCAGMFGNVLNLRHLAHLLGSERPFYGLQAKGLYGDDAPHETFEEMARDYIAEMRVVQPHGPYFVGGFSGGGYAALEIARQLEAAGESIGLVVLLDTPGSLQPHALTLSDRALIQAQRLKRKGPRYVVEWAQSRVAWEVGQIRKRFEEPEQVGQEEFHNQAIEAAFRRALTRYQIPRWEQKLVLFRPPLDKCYVLGPDRILNRDRDRVYHDNGWSRFCPDVDVYEVPGDHDSMVLEPNVRVMAARLRNIIEEAEAKHAVPATVCPEQTTASMAAE